MTNEATDEERSAQMRLIRSKNTKPELIIRKLLFALGYRYRLHAKKLPGRPDLSFSGRKKAIYVHGCFWHRHPNCRKSRTPKSRLEYWESKFASNLERDLRNQQELQKMGWRFLIVWECELKNIEALKEKMIAFLDSS